MPLPGARGRDGPALQLHERTRRNVEGGYWIAEADPEAARHAVRRRYRTGDVRALALLSEGAASIVTEYGVLDWGPFLSRVQTDPAEMLRTTHNLEAHDPDGVQWPRTKRHDDKTVVLRAGWPYGLEPPRH